MHIHVVHAYTKFPLKQERLINTTPELWRYLIYMYMYVHVHVHCTVQFVGKLHTLSGHYIHVHVHVYILVSTP